MLSNRNPTPFWFVGFPALTALLLMLGLSACTQPTPTPTPTLVPVVDDDVGLASATDAANETVGRAAIVRAGEAYSCHPAATGNASDTERSTTR